jgi:thiol:disulfide interchange protein DsbD
MGLLSALIVGPCVAPPLAGALLYIGQSGDVVLGGLALFVLSLGMGTPLLLIGTSAGRWLPRAGAWMEAVKAVFGVLLLAVALGMLERILPAALTLPLWAALYIVCAVYLGALEPLHAAASGWQWLKKGVGVVVLVQGVLVLIGAASGGDDPFQPLRHLRIAEGTAGEMSVTPAFRHVADLAALEREFAADKGRPVLLDFYADWCVECKRMERYTFSDPEIRAALAEVVLLQADVTKNTTADKALLRHFSLIGPPAILFFGPDGAERPPRVVGFMDAGQFRTYLEGVLR